MKLAFVTRLSNTVVKTPRTTHRISSLIAIALIGSAFSFTACSIAAASSTPSYSSGFNNNGLTMNGGAGLNGSRLRLTDNNGGEARSAFFSSPVNIQKFSTSFEFQLTNPLSEGFTFTLTSAGPGSLGQSYQWLGYGGYGAIGNSIAIKFDLKSNQGEGSDSTGLYTNGADPTTPSIDLSSTGINLHSGDIFNAQLTYNGSTLTVVITDTATHATATQTYSTNIPSIVGGDTAYVGFTGATGNASSVQEILNWTYSASSSGSPNPPPPPVSGNTLAAATVSTSAKLTIPRNFMGLSMYWTQPYWMGQSSTGVNNAFRQLVQNLTANSSAPMLIRILGDDSQPSDLQPTIEPLAEFAQAVNANYALGVDMWHNNVSDAQSEANAWVNGMPNYLIQAFELGNEPDVYPYNGARSSNYDFPAYLSQFQQWERGVDSTTSNRFGVMGPAYGVQGDWVSESQSALASGALSANIVSQHSYLGGQRQASGQSWPSDYLLRPNAATDLPVSFSGFAASAHQAGRLFRIGEMNSFWNGGVGGISDTFSSALWSIDIMFNYLSDGVDGVNWHHSRGTNYRLFDFGLQTWTGRSVFNLTEVKPLYYGLLVFSQMAARNAKLLPVSTSTNSNVSIWATIDSKSTVHVVVINKDKNATGNVQISLPGYNTGTIRYLTAANYSATNGVTFGGQTFDGSGDGTIQGNLITTTIQQQNGKFTVPNVRVTSAAVIDFTH